MQPLNLNSLTVIANLLMAKVSHQVTGDEEPMYHAKVVVTRKVRKNDLPVKSGDTVGIIRTTSCPKGKWLARDGNNKCESAVHLCFHLGGGHLVSNPGYL